MCKIYPGYWAWAPCCERWRFYKHTGGSITYDDTSWDERLCTIRDCGRAYKWECHGAGIRQFVRYDASCKNALMERWVQDNPDLEQATPEEIRTLFREEYNEFYPKRRLPDDSRLLNRGFPVFESLWAIHSPPEHWGRNGTRWDPTVEPPRQHIREPESAEEDQDEDDESETSTLRRGSTDTERQFHPALEYPGEESDPYNLTDVYYDAFRENEPVWPEFPYNNHHESIIGPHQSGLEAAFLGLDVDDRSTPTFQDTRWPDQHQSGLEALASYYPTEEELDQAAADGFMYDERAGEFVPHDQ